MTNLVTLFKRELKAYFYSPIAYAMIVIFLAIAGFFFYTGMSFYGLESFEMSRRAQFMGPQELSLADFVLRPLFGNLSVVMLLLMPILTMRLFSEEKKSGSIEFLFTWPLRDAELALGKYLAALFVFAVTLVLTFSYVGFIWWYSDPPWLSILTGYLGLFLLGASFLSLGVFVSTLTENQIISAAVSFGALLLFYVAGAGVASRAGTFYEVLAYLSIFNHFDQFSKGVIDTSDVIYYLSFTFLFLFFTLRSLESNKWRG